MSLLLPPSAETLLERSVSRRGFLTGLGIATAGAMCLTSGLAQAATAIAPIAETMLGGESRDLSLYNQNTQERIATIFFQRGGYDRASLTQLNHFLRDAHEEVTHDMDPRLMTMLYDLQTIFDKREIQVISGYRTAKTNAMLAKTVPGVAKDSYHMKGRAVDIRIPGVDVAMIRDVARTLEVGGVGFYPQANFVHIDTGPIRHW